MALSMLPDNKETATFNKMGNGYFYYADFLELGTSVGLSEKFIAKSIDTLVSKMNKMEDLVQQSFLNDTRKQLFVDLMNNRKARLIE